MRFSCNVGFLQPKIILSACIYDVHICRKCSVYHFCYFFFFSGFFLCPSPPLSAIFTPRSASPASYNCTPPFCQPQLSLTRRTHASRYSQRTRSTSSYCLFKKNTLKAAFIAGLEKHKQSVPRMNLACVLILRKCVMADLNLKDGL